MVGWFVCLLFDCLSVCFVYFLVCLLGWLYICVFVCLLTELGRRTVRIGHGGLNSLYQSSDIVSYHFTVRNQLLLTGCIPIG